MPPAHERYEEAAQLRDAMRTVQILRDRQQKVATAQLGDRDVFGLKVGPSGGAIHVFAMRGGRVVERVELVTDPAPRTLDAARAAATPTCCRRRWRSSTSCACRRPRSTCRWTSRTARRWRSGCRRAPAAASGFSCRSAATSGRSWSWRRATLSSPYRTRFNETHRRPLRRPGDAAQRPRAAGDSAAHRVLRHLDDSGQRDRGVDGRVRRRADEEERVSEVPDRERRHSRTLRLRRSGIRNADDFAAMREVVQRRYRKVLEEGGPFPDLILIDGGTGQLSAAYEALEADRARATWWRSASPRKRKCCSPATGRSRSCCRRTIRRCC